MNSSREAVRPRIAIPVPTTASPEYNRRSWPNYAEAVRRAGGEPVALEPGHPLAELRRLAATCHGILLPGSPADVEPSRFGAERDPATSPSDLGREALDFALLDDAKVCGRPVLGICFGCQSMNVWAGGSLVQDLLPVPVNHSAGREVAVAHAALIARDSVLGSLVSPDEAPTEGLFLRLPVNTSHHQAVAQPGKDFRISARCPDDGVIEAIESGTPADWFALGVQWHPERSTELSATSRNLFDRLVREASQFASRPEVASSQPEA